MRHRYLHHVGYPTDAGWRLALALRESPEPALLPRSFLEHAALGRGDQEPRSSD